MQNKQTLIDDRRRVNDLGGGVNDLDLEVIDLLQPDRNRPETSRSGADGILLQLRSTRRWPCRL